VQETITTMYARKDFGRLLGKTALLGKSYVHVSENQSFCGNCSYAECRMPNTEHLLPSARRASCS